MTPFGSEPLVRLGCYVAVLAAVAWAELVWPRRRADLPRRNRWPGNLLVSAIGTLCVRVALPAGLVGIGVLAEQRDWGLLNHVSLPKGIAALGSVVLLDLTIYAQHVVFHKVPVLWRVHRMHHTDLHVDVTTGVRFHPVELLLSMGIKAGAVVLLGAPAAAVLVFEVLLNATSMFSHGNLRIPAAADRLLRAFVVTPDMHRVHHSAERVETDSNFGFNLAWWDRLFGTYRAEPALGQAAMRVGLEEWRERRDSRLDRLLLQPLQHASRT